MPRRSSRRGLSDRGAIATPPLPPRIRAVPSPALRGRKREIVLAMRSHPSFANFAARDLRQTLPAVGPVWSRSSRRTDESKKGSGTPKGAVPSSAPCGAALRLSGAHASRRSTAVLAQGTIHPKGSAQARLRGRRRQTRRVAPANAAPSSSDAPRAPVIVPAGMMPEPPECEGDEPNARGHRTRSAKPASPASVLHRSEIRYWYV